MDFAPSQRVAELRGRVRAFMAEHVMPVEDAATRALDDEVAPGVAYPAILVELRERARAEGLWNLFLPDEEHGPGLANWEYGLLCEEMGRSPVAPMVFNCAAPDTGNMEVLAEYGTDEQQAALARPAARRPRPQLLLDDRARDGWLGPDRAGGARRAATDDEWAIDGHKWFTSGYDGASVAIAMVVTDPDAAPHKRASMILVPIDAPGFTGVRPVPVMGHARGPGHWEVTLRRLPRPGGQPARPARRRLRDRPGRGSGRAASTTACARSARPSGRSS